VNYQAEESKNKRRSMDSATQTADFVNHRSRQRFPLRLAIRCRQTESLDLDRIIVGESLNISSKGLRFTTAEAFQPGQIVEGFIDWPVLLDNRIRLKLVVEGPVVWKVGDEAAMRIDRYEFRTRGPAERRPGYPVAITACDSSGDRPMLR
jgi:hypothetical protein